MCREKELCRDPAKDFENIQSGNQVLGKAFSGEKAQNVGEWKGRKSGETINMFNWETENISQVPAMCAVERNEAAEFGENFVLLRKRGFRPSIIHPELVRRLVLATVVASHMSCITEVETALVGAFVGTVLQGDDGITGTQLFLSELALVLLSLLGSNGRFAELGSLTTESLQADDDRVQILLLPQIDRLEQFLVGHAEFPGRFQEAVDVLHALEGHFALLDASDGVGLQSVGQFAEENSVSQLFEDVVRVAGEVVGHASDLVDPFQNLASVLFAVLAHDLGLSLSSETRFGCSNVGHC